MIGLIDYDFLSSEKLTQPNLEIMKLYTYYTKEERQFCRLLDVNEDNFSTYEKIYFMSEKNSEIESKYRGRKNFIYGGSALTGNVYQPFENKLIDYSLPTVQPYKAMLFKRMEQETATIKEINNFLDYGYYRCYAGDIKLPLPFFPRNKRIYLYDRDFFYDDWENVLKTITKRKPSTIMRIHPVYCNGLSQFFTLRNYPKFSRQNEIVLNLDIPYNQFHMLFHDYELKFKATISEKSNVAIGIGGNFKYTNDYYEDFRYKMNLLYSFWARHIPIKLQLIPTAEGYYNPIENLTKKIVTLSEINTPLKKSQTIFDVLTKKSIEEDEAKKILRYNLQWQPLFMRSYDEIYKSRVWRF